MTNPEEIPEPYASIIDDVCDKDRAYFEDNPDTSFYIRSYVEGEFFPRLLRPSESYFVRVDHLMPGLRTRALVVNGK